MEFPTPIITKIPEEPTRELLINLHHILKSNTASVASNFDRGSHVHPPLTMVADNYLAHMRHKLVPPFNPDNYPPNLGTLREQVLGMERFCQTKRCSGGKPPLMGHKKTTIIETFFLYPIKDQLAGFGQVMDLETMDHIFRAYGEIGEIDMEENDVKMMGPYNPAELLLASLIENLEKGR